MEVYVDGGLSEYPRGGPPVLAVRGGGLPGTVLRALGAELREEAATRAADEPGEPQILNLLAFAGEMAASRGFDGNDACRPRSARAALNQ